MTLDEIQNKMNQDQNKVQRKIDIFLSPGYLLSISILIVNDLYLKQAFHNVLTGKLSDFAGLFAFCLFWCALFPKYRSRIAIIIGALFVVWKSQYSQVLINAWNELNIWNDVIYFCLLEL